MRCRGAWVVYFSWAALPGDQEFGYGNVETVGQSSSLPAGIGWTLPVHFRGKASRVTGVDLAGETNISVGRGACVSWWLARHHSSTISSSPGQAQA